MHGRSTQTGPPKKKASGGGGGWEAEAPTASPAWLAACRSARNRNVSVNGPPRALARRPRGESGVQKPPRLGRARVRAGGTTSSGPGGPPRGRRAAGRRATPPPAAAVGGARLPRGRRAAGGRATPRGAAAVGRARVPPTGGRPPGGEPRPPPRSQRDAVAPTSTRRPVGGVPPQRPPPGGCASVAGRGSPTDRRTELPVRQQANRCRSVGPSVWATDPEQNVNLFGVTVGLSRGGSAHVNGCLEDPGSLPPAKHVLRH